MVTGSSFYTDEPCRWGPPTSLEWGSLHFGLPKTKGHRYFAANFTGLWPLSNITSLIKLYSLGKNVVNIPLLLVYCTLCQCISLLFQGVSSKEQWVPLYIHRIPHTMQDYKDKACVLPFSKCPEGIFLLFKVLDALTSSLDKTDWSGGLGAAQLLHVSTKPAENLGPSAQATELCCFEIQTKWAFWRTPC